MGSDITILCDRRQAGHRWPVPESLIAIVLWMIAISLAPTLAQANSMKEFVSGGHVTAHFGLGRDGQRDHTGIDVAAPKGTPILAPDDALVIDATDIFRDEPRFGKAVVLQFGNKILAWFTHLDSCKVKPGDRRTWMVSRNQR